MRTGPKTTTRAWLGRYFNAGAAALWSTGVSAPEIGRTVGGETSVNPSVVLRWLSGDSRPSRAAAAALEAHYGIALLTWDEPAPADFALPRLNGAHKITASQDCAPVHVGIADTGERLCTCGLGPAEGKVA